MKSINYKNLFVAIFPTLFLTYIVYGATTVLFDIQSHALIKLLLVGVTIICAWLFVYKRESQHKFLNSVVFLILMFVLYPTLAFLFEYFAVSFSGNPTFQYPSFFEIVKNLYYAN